MLAVPPELPTAASPPLVVQEVRVLCTFHRVTDLCKAKVKTATY